MLISSLRLELLALHTNGGVPVEDLLIETGDDVVLWSACTGEVSTIIRIEDDAVALATAA